MIGNAQPGRLDHRYVVRAVANREHGLPPDTQRRRLREQRFAFHRSAQELGISPAYASKRTADRAHGLEVTRVYRTTRRVQLSERTGPLRISTSLRLDRNHVAPILSRPRPGLRGVATRHRLDRHHCPPAFYATIA